MARRFLPAGTLTDGADPVLLTPEDAGWTYSGLRVLALAPGERRTLDTGDSEIFVLPLSATGVTVEVHGASPQTFELDGRTSVFARVTDFLYVGRDIEYTISAPHGGEVALPSARCERSLPPRYGSADAVAIEIRGAGPATRQVTNFGSPDTWPHADRLMCVELLTPDGNWSSYPPHKHDDSPECPVNNEEAYYFRIGRAGTTDYEPEGFGLHRTYTGDGLVDDNLTVADGDVYLIPRGYHGPCVAAPGYTMYYLNVLAGPGGERSMAFCDDPSHHWVRDSWAGMQPDPRCPMTDANGTIDTSDNSVPRTTVPTSNSHEESPTVSRSPFLSRVAAAPISWGICEAPGWGMQLPVDRVLGEARGLGITAFEQGSLGWLPTDPVQQRAKLGEFGISLLGGFVALVLHDTDRRDEQLAEADRIAAAMAAAGGTYFVSCPVPALDDWHHPALTDAEWSELLANLDRVDSICASHGLTQVVHPHLYTDIESAEDFQRFLDGCSAKFCFDTGHLTIGGADVVAIAHRYRDRIGIVHLKDVDGEIARRERAGEFDLMGATQAGLFPSIGDGVVPIADVVDILESNGYQGWYVMETDVALTDGEPPVGEGPVHGVARSLTFLRSLDVA